MKKTISLAMAAALAVSGAITTVPVFADDVTNITIWSPTDRESIEAWWKERISEWNEEHPEIQVSREAIDRSDSYAYDNKIATAVTSNDLPDIFYVDGPQVSYYAANGRLPLRIARFVSCSPMSGNPEPLLQELIMLHSMIQKW